MSESIDADLRERSRTITAFAVLASPAMRAFLAGAVLLSLGAAGPACGRDDGGIVHAAASHTKLAVDQLAFSHTPQWAVATGKQCPESLLEVAQHVGKTEQDLLDPWGTPYELFCGEGNLPPGVSRGYAVMSYGPDKKKGTEDDIASWRSR
jgi:hypothetical protein